MDNGKHNSGKGTDPKRGAAKSSKAASLAARLDADRVSLRSVIGLVDRIVEMNDLYTADHQRRVARLARAIAEEMALDDDTVAAVYVAASVLDVGKIYIPDDILNKPEALTDGESRIAHNHAEAGRYMLEGMEFPWPIAKIVYQHHELLDGSGYPDGLQGNAICMEALIIGVADVVEAMSSPRPHRSALGVDKALEVITLGRGSLYDPAVVNACVKLFSTKGFSFE